MVGLTEVNMDHRLPRFLQHTRQVSGAKTSVTLDRLGRSPERTSCSGIRLLDCRRCSMGAPADCKG